jgi:hypothetical protein
VSSSIATEHRGGLAPLVALQPEQDGGLVREVLVDRPDAHARAFGHARGGEALRAFPGQNLKGGLEDGRDEVVGTRLLGLLARGDPGLRTVGHGGPSECEWKT